MARIAALLIGVGCLGISGWAGYAALVAGPDSPTHAASPTGLIVENPIHDFGPVGQMETLQAEFRVVNHSPTAVSFLEILHGCACSDTDLTHDRLEPGQAATLTVGWRTGSRRGKSNEVVTLDPPRGRLGRERLRVSEGSQDRLFTSTVDEAEPPQKDRPSM